MSRTGLTWLLALGLSLSACGSPSTTPSLFGDAPPDTAIAQSLLRALDTDQDGTLDSSEAAALLSPAEFKAADVGGAGKLDVAELSEFLARQGAPSNAAAAAGLQGADQVHADDLAGIGLVVGVGLGVIGTGYLTYAGLKGAHDVMWPELSQATTKPAELGLVADDVTFDSDVLGLKGWYIHASTPTERCVVFQHGHGGNKSQFLREFGPWLAAKYNVLTFDFRGCGESPHVACSLGYFETRELLAAVTVARKKGNTSIGLMGISMGAAAALDAAAQDTGIRGVVADCAFSDFYHAFYQRIINRHYPLPGPVAKAIQKALEIELHAPVSQAGPVINVSKLASRPVLIIQGEADDETTPDNATLLFNACSEPKALWMVPGAKHAKAHATAPREYEQRVMDFWAKAL